MTKVKKWIADHVTVASSQLTVTTDMSFGEFSNERVRFFTAAYHGRLEEVIELSKKFSNDVLVLKEALLGSCMMGHLDVVTWLGKHTAAVVNYNNNEDLWLITPLWVACTNDHLDIVKYLVETYHADINSPDKQGNRLLALTVACSNDSTSVPDIVKYLVETCHADVNSIDNKGNTPLSWACRYVRMPLSMYLLFKVNDLDINIVDSDGNTALHYAV